MKRVIIESSYSGLILHFHPLLKQSKNINIKLYLLLIEKLSNILLTTNKI